MAFGIDRNELKQWKRGVEKGYISFLTHYWMDERFPKSYTVTKVGCVDVEKLAEWGETYGLKAEWIHLDKKYPHFDLLGERQKEILAAEGKWDQIKRFNL